MLQKTKQNKTKQLLSFLFFQRNKDLVELIIADLRKNIELSKMIHSVPVDL